MVEGSGLEEGGGRDRSKLKGYRVEVLEASVKYSQAFDGDPAGKPPEASVKLMLVMVPAVEVAAGNMVFRAPLY
jgi:hypothetical protein